TIKEASASGALAQARFLHFATHGVLGLAVGQQPALVLSLVGNDGQRDEDGGINDGFLRLDEVPRLRLTADLVVLSACGTVLGAVHPHWRVRAMAIRKSPEDWLPLVSSVIIVLDRLDA